jgi:hypothetical protein
MVGQGGFKCVVGGSVARVLAGRREAYVTTTLLLLFGLQSEFYLGSHKS